MIKPVMGLAGASIGIGLGSSVVEKAGGSAAPLATMGKHLPIAGKVVGGNIMINTLLNFREDINKKLKKKRLMRF